MKLLHRGKVRDVFEVDPDHLVLVASDRISAFDVVLAEPIPDKGRVLTGLTVHWLETGLGSDVPHHLVSAWPSPDTTLLPPLLDLRSAPPAPISGPLAPAGRSGPAWPAGSGAEAAADDLAGRALLVRRAQMLPIECIVRAHLAGSAWAEYRRSATVHGHALPPGLVEADALPEPLFTPSTKAGPGEHDRNLTDAEAVDLVGAGTFDLARQLCLRVFELAAARARAVGLILADTKFELGFIDGELSLCDEVLTPDSSRIWQSSSLEPGRTPPSFDKQPVRDWLTSTGWDRSSPAPPLPPEVVEATRARYVEAYERLTGTPFSTWLAGPRQP